MNFYVENRILQATLNCDFHIQLGRCNLIFILEKKTHFARKFWCKKRKFLKLIKIFIINKKDAKQIV